MPLIIMKTSEQITNQLRIQGLMKPLKIPVSTLSKWRDEFAKLEAGNERLRELLKKQTLWSDEAINSLLRKETPCP